jgi:hypothetical protein
VESGRAAVELGVDCSTSTIALALTACSKLKRDETRSEGPAAELIPPPRTPIPFDGAASFKGRFTSFGSPLVLDSLFIRSPCPEVNAAP